MKKAFPVIVTLLAVFFVIRPLFQPADRAVILARLEELRELAEVRGKSHPLELAADAKKISRYFTEQTTFDFTSADYKKVIVESRRSLSQKVMRGRAAMESLELAIQRPEVDIDGGTATVEFTGSALGSMPGREGQFLDIHRIRVFLIEEEGGWLISGAEHIRNERE